MALLLPERRITIHVRRVSAHRAMCPSLGLTVWCARRRRRGRLVSRVVRFLRLVVGLVVPLWRALRFDRALSDVGLFSSFLMRTRRVCGVVGVSRIFRGRCHLIRRRAVARQGLESAQLVLQRPELTQRLGDPLAERAADVLLHCPDRRLANRSAAGDWPAGRNGTDTAVGDWAADEVTGNGTADRIAAETAGADPSTTITLTHRATPGADVRTQLREWAAVLTNRLAGGLRQGR